MSLRLVDRLAETKTESPANADHVPADSLATWVNLVRLSANMRHKSARANALAVADARARLAEEHPGLGFVSCVTLPEVSRQAGLNNDQARRGTTTLREWGLLTVVEQAGYNTPPTYLLTVAEEEAWRAAWAVPRSRAVPTSYPLTAEQEELRETVLGFIGGDLESCPKRDWPDHVMVVHGYAGAGKTTTTVRAIREAVTDLSDVLFVAPSNKAAAVLRDQGVAAGTIHNAFYKMTGEDPETGEPIFVQNPFNDGQHYPLVVVDEVSMVAESTAKWIESQARRIIAIGDPMQLSPVNGTPRWTAPGCEPDVLLTEVVRASNSELAWVGQAVRQGAGLSHVASVGVTGPVDPLDFDVVITNTNEDRLLVNHLCRETGPPRTGDPIMLLASTRGGTFDGPDNYFNGQVLTVTRLVRSSSPGDQVTPHHEVECTDEHGMPRRLLIQNRWLADTARYLGAVGDEPHRPRIERLGSRDVHPATYAYAITAHKAQGSGWDSVLVVPPASTGRPGRDELHRWEYTAATRARTRLAVARLDLLLGRDGECLVSGAC